MADFFTFGSGGLQETVRQIFAKLKPKIDTSSLEVRHISGNITALPKSFSYAFISADHRGINCVLGTPSAVTSDLAWTTSAGDVTFTGTLANLGSTTIDFDIVKVVTP